MSGVGGRGGVFASASAALMAAIACCGVADADPSQEERFLRLLEDKQIPAIDNVPGLIDRAHEICEKLDDGTSFETIRDEETGIMGGGSFDPGVNPARVNTTAHRFIAASVEVYCPNHQDRLP